MYDPRFHRAFYSTALAQAYADKCKAEIRSPHWQHIKMVPRPTPCAVGSGHVYVAAQCYTKEAVEFARTELTPRGIYVQATSS